MKIATINGSPAIVDSNAGRFLDIARSSNGEYPGAMEILARWDEFRHWAQRLTEQPADWQELPARTRFGPPVPRPGQILAAGTNYPKNGASPAVDGIAKSRPGFPETFMKSPSAITAPYGDIEVPSDSVDYEVDLVAVIGRGTSRSVTAETAMDHIAGFMIGQDVSDRALQSIDPPALSIAKSFPTFAPTGPWFVTPDELGDLSDLAITCSVNGVEKQRTTLGSMLRSVPEIVELYSAVGLLMPGDQVYFGTPDGVGMRQDPAQYLRDGDLVRSEIEGIGHLENRCVAVEITVPFYQEGSGRHGCPVRIDGVPGRAAGSGASG